jgi:release factor glutamine methyltransferase
MNVRMIFEDYHQQLQQLYPKNEAMSLTLWLLEEFLGIKKINILQEKILPEIPESLSNAFQELLTGKPIQYITSKAPFYGREFKVSPAVLIPRNETEELVHLIIKENKQPQPKILDIGTGSGCIPITLFLEIPNAEIDAIDISEEALEIAKSNAKILNSKVHFHKIDILNDTLPNQKWDIIVSNPPYVKASEKALMHKNVLDFEPHLALFVEDEDPLLFYKKITALATQHLSKKGKIYFEINEALGNSTCELLISNGFDQVQLLQDLNGKDRMVTAVYP